MEWASTDPGNPARLRSCTPNLRSCLYLAPGGRPWTASCNTTSRSSAEWWVLLLLTGEQILRVSVYIQIVTNLTVSVLQLLDNVENKMKGTCVEGTIPKLFRGKMVVRSGSLPIFTIPCQKTMFNKSKDILCYKCFEQNSVFSPNSGCFLFSFSRTSNVSMWTTDPSG